ncbi:MAG TPA: cupin domain-containing protein [Planktothrix sp.]|jgi:1,2-dihydroxy-3-keto-5-methylthiopentene dioxygenase
MARLRVPDENITLTSAAEISAFVAKFGLWYERWETSAPLSDNATQDEILSAYSKEIETLKARGGYQTADVINVTPATPGLDAMLERFLAEHTHSEDEVRFVVKGRGVFHINPISAPVFAIEMEAGDMINVPKGTQHWFNLCSDKTIQTIRLFQETTGWAPHYMDSPIHARFEPGCFGPTYIEAAR